MEVTKKRLTFANAFPLKREHERKDSRSVLIILTLLSGTLSGYLMYQKYRIKSEFAEIHTEIANETVSITGHFYQYF